MMICFVAAFTAEARPIIQKYQFKLRDASPFPLYESNIGFLIVSGMGKKSAAAAVAHLAKGCPTNSIWINVGIAGHCSSVVGTPFLAHKIVDLTHNQGQVLITPCIYCTSTRSVPKGQIFHNYLLGAVLCGPVPIFCWYPQILFRPACQTATVFTVERCEQEYLRDGLYDMEAAGFFAEASHASTAELIHSFKIVSDNAVSPARNVSSKLAGSLVEKNLKILDHLVNELAAIQSELPVLEPKLAPWFLERWHFTVTEKHQLKRKLLRLQVLDPNNSFLDEVRTGKNSRRVLSLLERHLEGLPVEL